MQSNGGHNRHFMDEGSKLNKEQIIRQYLSQLGKKGGSVKGPQKARKLSPEHYKKVSLAMKKRWDKWRKENNKEKNMKLKKMKFDEEKMSQEIGELIEKKALNKCKPKGVGVFSYSDAPAAAGGGNGIFLWFKNWRELYQFLANYLIAMSPGPISEDHNPVYEKTWNILCNLAEGKIQREDAIQQINQAAKSYSQIEWWGTFKELYEGTGEFETKVRAACLRDDAKKGGPTKLTDQAKKQFIGALSEYGI